MAHRRAISFHRVGARTDRAYSLEDAPHVAIIAEMSRRSLAITGKGAEFSDILLGYAGYRLREYPRIERTP